MVDYLFCRGTGIRALTHLQPVDLRTDGTTLADLDGRAGRLGVRRLLVARRLFVAPGTLRTCLVDGSTW